MRSTGALFLLPRAASDDRFSSTRDPHRVVVDMSKAALYLSTCIARSSKSQKQIALETGYPQSNILSMFKKGQTKIPVNAVIPLADAIGGDRLFLMRLVLEDHFPDCHEGVVSENGK